MEAKEIYTLTELIVLIILTAIGTGAYLGFSFVSKKIVVNTILVIVVYLINLFVVCVLVEFIRLKDFFKYRYLVELIGSYAGMYFLKWADKRSFNIFDSLAKKTGIDIKDNIENEINPKDF